MAVGAAGASVPMVAVETLGDITITKPKVSPKAPNKAFGLGISVKKEIKYFVSKVTFFT